MFIKKQLVVLFFGLVTFISVHPLQVQERAASAEIIQTINESRASNAFWSVIVRDSTGKMLESYNADKLVRPASNLKLLTSAAILDELGSDYTYKTRMYGLGEQQGDTWFGNIIIRGVGDPSISGEFYNDDRFHVFEKFYQALNERGIKQINGNLVGNVSFFDEEVYPKGWSWEDLSFYYGVEISPLSFNNNTVDLQVYADGEVGNRPYIRWFPFDTDYVSFINDQVIAPAHTEYDEFYRRRLGTNTIILKSKLPQNYIEKESLSVWNAPRFFVDTFMKYLEQGNIKLNGHVRVDAQSRSWDDDKFKVLAEHESVSLQRLLHRINRESDNFYAEMLLKTMAAEYYDPPGSTELGLELVKEFAASMKMDTTQLELDDASGMSPSTLINTRDLSQLLVNMQHHPEFDTYFNSFAVAGQNGLLNHRFRNTSLEGKLWGKTGYVSGVRSLSGYMQAKSGKKLIFSIIANNYTEKTSYIDRITEKLVHSIYNRY